MASRDSCDPDQPRLTRAPRRELSSKPTVAPPHRRDADLGHQRDRFRPVVLGARPRRPGRPKAGSRDEMVNADWRFSQDENDDTVHEVSRDLERVVGMGADLRGLPLPFPHQLERVPPHRHDAPDESRQGVDGDPGDRCPDHLALGGGSGGGILRRLTHLAVRCYRRYGLELVRSAERTR